MKRQHQLFSYPRVGVAAVVTHQQRVLFGKRILTNEDFVWQLPGGWIEPGESPEQTVRREVVEETGLGLDELRFVGLTNNIFSDQKHSISLYFEAECSHPENLSNQESCKCEQWIWMDWQELPDNLYLPLQKLINTEYRPFSANNCGIHVSF